MTHTPGPWALTEGNRDLRQMTFIHKKDDFLIGYALCESVHEKQRAEDLDNAKLIAAAPELLAALIDLRKELRAAMKMDVRKHFSLMNADAQAGNVILKATTGE